MATLVSLALFARPASTPVDEDEIYWIGSTYYHHLAFVRGDWSHADWALLPARENPPVAKYVLGLGLAAAGQPVTSPDLLGAFYLLFEKIPGAWGTGAEYAKRAAVVLRVSPELREKLQAGARLRLNPAMVLPARRVVIGCAVLTSLLLLLLGWQATGPVAGLLASQLILLHPATVHAYNHAHSDVVALLLATAAATATFLFVGRATADHAPSGFRLFGAALLTGALLGLACGAKMNSLVVAGLAGAAISSSVFAVRRHGFARVRQMAFAGLTVFLTALVVFVVLNPAVLQDLPAGLRAVVQEHRLTEKIQASFLSGHLVTLPEKTAAVAQLTALSSPALVLLTLLALGALAAKRPAPRFAAAWYLIGLICVTVWIPFCRGRYALPVILPAVFLGAVLADIAISALVARFRRSAAPAAEAEK